MISLVKGRAWLACLFISIACNESEILNEVPLDFNSLENAYVSYDDFNAAVYSLYDQTRVQLSDGNMPVYVYLYGTDIGYNGAVDLNNRFGSYPASLTVVSTYALSPWRGYYKIISSANIILNRLQSSQITDEQKRQIEASARLFRGLCYRNLAHLYGGVPIELEEVSQPRTDYVRASRNEVYEQAAADLEFAAGNLPAIDRVRDGEVSADAANHLLAETYVALGRWANAIEASSKVINNPNLALMTERFGSLASEPGDVYWDLFRRYNQNRSAGNTEGIWVFQYEVDVLGGVTRSAALAGPQLEREHAPRPYVFAYKDPTGEVPFLPLGVSDYSGGRGIGSLRGTNHFNYTIWKYDWDDMRNSEYNFVRDVKFNNPASVWYGHKISDYSHIFRQAVNDTLRSWYPYQSKVTTPGQHPAELFVDANLKTLNASAAGTTYSDQYFIRLAETYLLRAEAHLGNGDLASAAADINVVRARANAKPVTPDMIDIQFILDERMRELGVEEKRRLTLNRLGLLYDRVSRYAEGNPVSAKFGLDVAPHHNLFPIPFSEIESNTGAEIEQNQGY